MEIGVRREHRMAIWKEIRVVVEGVKGAEERRGTKFSDVL